MIKDDSSWPKRQKYSFMKIFSTLKEANDLKAIVHGYLGSKASSELEQFMSESELRRTAHKENGIWLAATRSTFHSSRPDLFPEKPYLIHQNSPLA